MTENSFPEDLAELSALLYENNNALDFLWLSVTGIFQTLNKYVDTKIPPPYLQFCDSASPSPFLILPLYHFLLVPHFSSANTGITSSSAIRKSQYDTYNLPSAVLKQMSQMMTPLSRLVTSSS